MDETVLKPLGMVSNTYSQPLPEHMAVRAAKGYGGIFGQSVNGGGHVYPEMAPAGLWTTAGDLARFAIGIQSSVAGHSNPVISQSLTRQMLTVEQMNYGLGLGLRNNGRTLRFGHDGANAGFNAVLLAYAHLGKGAVVMINKNEHTDAMSQIFGCIAEQYHWPDYKIPPKK